MTYASVTQFHVYLLLGWVNARLAHLLNCVLNVKAVEAAINQEKALIGAFSVIVKTDCETDGSSLVRMS